MGLLIDAAWYFLQGMIGLRLSEASLRGPPGRRRVAFFARDDLLPLVGGQPSWAS